MRLKVSILLSLLVWMCAVEGRAQKNPIKTITVNFVKKVAGSASEGEAYYSLVKMIVVKSEREGDGIAKKYNKALEEDKEMDVIAYQEKNSLQWDIQETSTGVKQIDVALGQAIVYFAGGKAECVGIDKEVLARMSIDIVIKGENEARELEKVDIYAKIKGGGFVNQNSESFGLDKDFNLGLDIADSFARDNARAVFQPVVYYKDSKGKEHVYCYLRPFVVDGQGYHVTQDRRMAFDLKNDPLDNYRQMKLRSGGFETDTVLTMQSYVHSGGHVRETIQKEAMTYKYKADVVRWFEDYNMVYRRDSLLGEYAERVPLRFLEYDNLIRTYSINKTRKTYIYEPKPEKRNQTGNLSLNFRVGKHELPPEDTLGHEQLNRLKAQLHAIYHSKDENIEAFHIKGQASPDGRFAKNQQLGKDRLQFAVNHILEVLPSDLIKTKESSVATWAMVADSLEAMGQEEPATRIKHVISSYPKDLDAQYMRIRKFPDYETLLVPIAERLRTVSYSFECIINRALSRAETVVKWKTDADVRSGLKPLPFYETYYLFDSLSNVDELQLVAQRAYDDTKKIRPDYPWPLAAYHLARCKLMNNQLDTMLLKPLLVDTIKGEQIGRNGFGEDTLAIRNDPAIVMLQVSMLMKYGNFGRAARIVQLASDSTKFKKISLFLDCLNGGYRTNPAKMDRIQEIRDTVANSSMWNRAVLYQAINEKDFDDKAIALMNDTSYFPDQEDLRLLYMKAIVKGRIAFRERETPDFTMDVMEQTPELLYCCLRDESYYHMALDDADFKKSVRKGLADFWKVLDMRRGDSLQVHRADSILTNRYYVDKDMTNKKLYNLIINRK